MGKSVSGVVQGKWAGECGRVSRVDFASVQRCPRGTGYLKTGTDSRVSPSTLTKKMRREKWGRTFSVSSDVNAHEFRLTECAAQAASGALIGFFSAPFAFGDN